MTKMRKTKKTAAIFVAILCLAFSGITMLHSQEPDASKRGEKAAERKKAKATKPANTTGAPDAPATSTGTKGSTKGSPKDTSRAAKTPVGKETVWVNTATGIYHKKGTRYYGKTKEGKYMPEDEAVQAGYKRSKRN